MRWIEVTRRDNSTEMVSYPELNGWLRENANHYVVVCYYRSRRNGTMRYEFINWEKTVPGKSHGMRLERVRL